MDELYRADTQHLSDRSMKQVNVVRVWLDTIGDASGESRKALGAIARSPQRLWENVFCYLLFDICTIKCFKITEFQVVFFE